MKKLLYLLICILFFIKVNGQEPYFLKIKADGFQKASGIGGCGWGCLPPTLEMEIRVKTFDGVIHDLDLITAEYDNISINYLRSAEWENILAERPVSLIVFIYYTEDSMYNDQEFYCVTQDEEIPINVSDINPSIFEIQYQGNCVNANISIENYPLPQLDLSSYNECNSDSIFVNAPNILDSKYINWKYRRTGSIVWEDLTLLNGNHNIGITLSDFNNIDINENIDIAINYKDNVFSGIKQIYYTDCSPGLVNDPPEVIAPRCSDSNDASIRVEFDRALADNERMLLYVEKLLPDDSWTEYDTAPILTSSDINDATGNTYEWDPILEPGTYRLRYMSKYDVTTIDPTPDPVNPNSDEMSANFEVVAPSAVTFTYSQENILCYGSTTGAITITATGGTGTGYQYSITNGTTWQDASTFGGLAPSTYTLLARDSNQCISPTSATVTLTEPPLPLAIAAVTIVNPTANGSSDGRIELFTTGGTGDVTYSWLKDGVSYATTTVAELTGLGAGSYEVTATDENGCSSNTLTIPLTEPPPLTIDFTVVQAIDCNGNTGSIRAQGVGGNSASYSYVWSNGTTGQDLLNVPAGTYSVTVTDGNSVSVTDTFELSQPEVLSANSTQVDISCFGGSDGSLTLTVTGGTAPYSIAWTDDTGITTMSRSGLSQGDYYYTVSDANACTVNGSVSITQPAVVEIVIDSWTDPSTVGGTDGAIEVSVTGGVTPYTYLWTDASGTTVATTEDISGLSDGNYTLLVTDTNGCTATISRRVSEPQPLSASVVEANPISCVGGSDGELRADPVGGSNSYAYEWFIEENGNYITLNITTQTITGLTSGNYRVIVTDTAGATTQADYVLDDPVPITVAGNVSHIHCYGGSDGAIDITVTGGTIPYTFSWTNSVGNTVGTSEDVSGLPSGSYSVFIIDSKGCTAIANFELTAPGEPLWLSSDMITDPSSAGAIDGAIAVTVTGGTPPYTYTWTDSSGTIISTDEDISGLGEDVYTLTVYDANSSATTDNTGCMISDDFALLAPDALIATINQEQGILCNGDATGILTGTGTGGYLDVNSVYSYQWFREENGSYVDLGQVTNRITGLTAGNYRVMITDDNGVTAVDTFIVTEPDVLSIALTITNDVSCTTGADGAIDAIVQGGTVPYTYMWSNGATGEDIAGLGVGNYTLTVTDANGCSWSESIALTQPGGMDITNTIRPPACHGGSDGSIALTVDGGTAPYTYLWNTGATTASIDNLMAGSYSVTVTDSAGCLSVLEFMMEDPDPLLLDLGEDRVLCSGQSLSMDVTIDDPGATYQWTATNGFSSTSPVVGLGEAGEYTLIITNGNGCTAQDAIVITTTEDAISADFLVQTQAFRNETIVMVDVSDPVPDRIEWVLPDEANIITQNGDYAEVSFAEEGVYTLTMIAYRGSCQQELTKEITVLPQTYEGSDDTTSRAFIQKFMVYPNPNNGVFKAEIDLQQSAPVSIKIINLVSNAITDVKVGRDQTSYVFDYSLNTAIGGYMLILETPKGSQVRKMIIN